MAPRPTGIRFTLADLEARFLKFDRWPNVPGSTVDGVTSPHPFRDSYTEVDSLARAHGVNFLCPKCYHANKGKVGTHRVTCWFEGLVPDNANPGPGRWSPMGSGLSDLTFVPGDAVKATSVLLKGGCGWHGHVIGGCATVIP